MPPFPVGLASGVAFIAITFIDLSSDMIQFAIQMIILFPFGTAIVISAFGYKTPANPANAARQTTGTKVLRSFVRNYVLIFLGFSTSFFPLGIASLLINGGL